MNAVNNCYALPYNSNFLRDLANYVIGNYHAEIYPQILILLPNRRSCIALRNAFLDVTGGKPMILPKIQPIGEIEEEAFLPELAGEDMPSKQPIESIRRHFLLMKLIMTHQHIQAQGKAKQAVELARQLASLLDEVNREGLSLDNLSKLAPEELQEHWQKTLDFLSIIAHEWPKTLEQEGVLDIVTHRNQLLNALATLWKKSPPTYPVIAAGSTGSQNATAELLTVIATLPSGMVLLPYLDKGMSKAEWDVIEETHPQFGLKRLLDRMGIDREKVPYLLNPKSGENGGREEYLRAIFAPSVVTAGWRKIALPDVSVINNIKLLEADTLLDEARAIAIAMRAALEVKEKSVALITPDRTLARMVSAQLRRFNVEIDDSAGKQLANSAPACFLRLVVEMVATKAAPAALLALMRHPLMAAGMKPAQCRKLSRELELLFLRDVRIVGGLGGIVKVAEKNKRTSSDLLEFLRELEKQIMPLLNLFEPHHNVALELALDEHLRLAEWLASHDKLSGDKILWAGDAGSKLAELIAQWNLQASILPPIDVFTYPALFEALLASEVYRSQAGLHPRLHILSPMEARLQRFDLVILASLNEGTWPQSEQPDPWMSRPQRVKFGLPSRDRMIGQSAHDFVMQLAASDILLTRSRKVEGSPTIASRWWVRMQTLLMGRVPEFFASMNGESYFKLASDILEKPADIAAIKSPAPMPPLSARPREMRVTSIDKWLRDPYGIYASYILALKKLKALDREPDVSDFGNIVHKALEIFHTEFSGIITDSFSEDIDVNNKLLMAGKVAFADFLNRPAVACLWWPRFMVIAKWVLKEEALRHGQIEQLFCEIKGKLELIVDGKSFVLSTRIDRIEKLQEGGYGLADYKTGGVPSKTDREKGFSNQLPLEALIIENGVLDKSISSGKVSRMEYWKLSGNEMDCEITLIKDDLEKSKARVEELVRKFDHETTPYTAQSDGAMIRFYEFEHLSRRKEWELV